jgi:hypothetical protein
VFDRRGVPKDHQIQGNRKRKGLEKDPRAEFHTEKVWTERKGFPDVANVVNVIYNKSPLA